MSRIRVSEETEGKGGRVNEEGPNKQEMRRETGKNLPFFFFFLRRGKEYVSLRWDKRLQTRSWL